MGHSASLCVPPNFKGWVESLGIECVPIGLDVQKSTSKMAQANAKHKKPSKAELRALAAYSVREYFRATLEAARGFDLIVVAGALQMAGRSVAEALRIPYVYAAYCPAALAAADHPPPKIRTRIRSQTLPRVANAILWKLDRRSWNRRFRATINDQRAALGLNPIADVQRYVSTDSPWLAADPILGPAKGGDEMQVSQTGTWFLSSNTVPLPDELERFLAAGEPPIYFGFGSMRASAGKGELLVRAARALGQRAIIAQGWGQLAPIDGAADCISIGEVNHELLFPRVAAIVHHGGAGTTATAARAGKPQAVVPHLYDQYYWAHRIEKLGIGHSGPAASQLSAEGLIATVRRCLEPEVIARAKAMAPRIEPHGARIAAERLVREFA